MRIFLDRAIKKAEAYLKKNGYNFQANISYLNNVFTTIRLLHLENPDLTSEEIKELFHQRLEELENNYKEVSRCSALLNYRNSLKDLIKDENSFKSIYEKCKDVVTQKEDNKSEVEDVDYDSIKEGIVKELIRTIRMNSDTDNAKFVRKTQNLSQGTLKQKYNLKGNKLKKFNIYKDLHVGDEFNRVKTLSTVVDEELSNDLKTIYIANMMDIGIIFDDFNLFEHYIAINKIENRKFDVDELMYALNSNDEENENLFKSFKSTLINKHKKPRNEIDSFVEEGHLSNTII